MSLLACIRKALCERNIRVVEAVGWTLRYQCHLPRQTTDSALAPGMVQRIVVCDECGQLVDAAKNARSPRMMFSESRSASGAQEDRRTQPRPCIGSIARFEQRDAGVYIELEAIAMSREIPAALRFVADPSVRRASRNSLLASLQRTEEAVRGSLGTVARSAGVPASAEQPPAFQQRPRIRAPDSLEFTDSVDWNTIRLE